MRTTLDIDDDLLPAVKQLARQKGITLGQAISQLARQSLVTSTSSKTRNGVRLFVPRTGASRPDLHVINQLRDEA